METLTQQDLIEKLGEETQIEMIIESCLKLALSLQKFKQSDKDEDFIDYTKYYNSTCSNIAEMKFMLEQSEFMFDKREIDKHHDLMLRHLKDELNRD
jgi:hypothetical protein